MGLLQQANKIFRMCMMDEVKSSWPEVRQPKRYDEEMSWAEQHGVTRNPETGEYEI